MIETTCEKCGEVLPPGSWPFCPHGPAKTSQIVRDEIPGGVVCENYGRHPITFYSHGERRRYMKEHGLNEREKFAPMPGTDKDPQGIPNPAGYIDDVTMANRAELFLRAHNHSTPKFDAVESGVMRGFFSGTMTERDAIAVANGDKRRQSRLGRRLKNGTDKG